MLSSYRSIEGRKMHRGLPHPCSRLIGWLALTLAGSLMATSCWQRPKYPLRIRMIGAQQP